MVLAWKGALNTSTETDSAAGVQGGVEAVGHQLLG